MSTETALPVAEEVIPAEVSTEVVTPPTEELVEAVEGEEKKEAKPEKTAEQREIDRLRRGIDRKTRQLAESRARYDLTRPSESAENRPQANDSEQLSLTRAELSQLVKAEAERLAPTVSAERTEAEHRRGVVESLAKSWGQEKFDQVAADLNDAFGGDEVTNALLDRSGKPKPAADAIFTADNPRALIEYLVDPDNADEAERIAGLGALQAGRAIAKLEAKLEASNATAKPQPSKAPKALEAIQGNSVADSQFNQSLEKASFAQYEAMRKKQGARWSN